jgi:flagellar M-ring protein FliF
MNRVFNSGPSVWTGLARAQQVLLLAVGLLVPALFFVGSQWVSDGQYVPLFASLGAEDAGAIVNQLKASKTPYRIGGNGDQILVPADRVAELRLRMAVQGLPLGGGVGFEVFDKPAFGASDFAQRLNYQRALQGELARTIGQLREVARARVHLVLPQPSLFADRERLASASVFLKLVAGAQLGREQIRGIVHLVASSVEGLAPERITVVDTAGRVLSLGGDGGGAGPLSPRRLEAKSAVEEELERRVQTLLDATLGAGQAVARVAAQLNFDQVERTEEKFDPNAVAKQKTKSVESTKGRSTTPSVAAGVPDPGSATAGQAAASVNQNDGNRESESVTYEVSRTIARTHTAPGDIRRLSVAVMLNTVTRVTQGPDKKEVRAAAPRSADDLEKIRKVVMGAVGFSETRGDQVTVVEMPFDTTSLDRERALLEQPAAPAPAPAAYVSPTVFAVVGGVLVVLIGAVLWLLLFRRRSRSRDLAEVALSLDREQVAAAGEAGAPSPRRAAPGVPRPPQPLVPEELLALSREREDIRHKAFDLATSEPDATAQLLRAWLVKKKSVRGGVDAS